MRRTSALTFVVVAGLMIVGCGSPSKMTMDMASHGADMSSGNLNCLGFGNCVFQCFNGAIPAGQNPYAYCGQQCAPMSKAVSINAWNKAIICAQAHCLGTNDAAVAKCLDDNGNLKDQQGAPTGTCASCIDNGEGSILGDFTGAVAVPPTGMCPNPGNVDCNGGAECASLFTTCVNDI
jgi:hypothetical protein